MNNINFLHPNWPVNCVIIYLSCGFLVLSDSRIRILLVWWSIQLSAITWSNLTSRRWTIPCMSQCIAVIEVILFIHVCYLKVKKSCHIWVEIYILKLLFCILYSRKPQLGFFLFISLCVSVSGYNYVDVDGVTFSSALSWVSGWTLGRH